jgi:predicted ferric reductase
MRTKFTLPVTGAILGILLPFIVAIIQTGANLDTPQANAILLSSLFGFVGTILLLVQYTLGTRTIAQFFTKDILGLREVHKKIGIYGILIFLLHPIFVIAAYNENLLYIISLSNSNPFELAVAFGRIALYLIVIIWISSAVLRKKIAYRPWKYLHYLSYIILPLSLLHAPRTGTVFAQAPWISFYWNLLVMIYIICIIARFRYSFEFGKTAYAITQQRMLRDNTYEITLQPDSTYLENSKPGQFLYLQITLFGEEHPFSIVEHNKETGMIALAYTAYGPFTKKLSQLDAGNTVLLDGPYGVFTSEVDENSVLIAGGIGITPFMQTLSDTEKKQPLLLFANRSPQLAPYHAKLSTILPASSYIPLYSEDPESPQFVTKEVIIATVPIPAHSRYFLCGPPAMITSVRKILSELGVPRKQIFDESFNS